jgi:hypothetical protein
MLWVWEMTFFFGAALLRAVTWVMMVHTLVASVIQVIMVRVVSLAQQGSTVVWKHQVVDEHFLLLFILALLYFVVY